MPSRFRYTVRMNEDDLNAHVARLVGIVSGVVLALAVMGFVTAMGLMLWSMEMHRGMFADMGSELPRLTQAFLAPGAAAWALVLGAVTVVLIGKEFAVRDPWVRLWINIPALLVGTALPGAYVLAIWMATVGILRAV